MSVFRIPAAVTTNEPVHWLAAGRNGAASFIACGAPVSGSRFVHLPHTATCPDCAAVVLRRKCYEPDPDATVLGLCCMRDLDAGATEHEGPHDWETPPTSALTDRERRRALDTPSDVLPRRVPGEALRTAVEFQQAMDDFQIEPSAENLAATREVIERWPA